MTSGTTILIADDDRAIQEIIDASDEEPDEDLEAEASARDAGERDRDDEEVRR